MSACAGDNSRRNAHKEIEQILPKLYWIFKTPRNILGITESSTLKFWNSLKKSVFLMSQHYKKNRVKNL